MIEGKTHVWCSDCREWIALPKNDNPVLVIEGETYLPNLVAMICPTCGDRIDIPKELNNGTSNRIN